MKAKLDEGDNEDSGDNENSGDDENSGDEEEDSSDGSDIELVVGKVKHVASAGRKGHPNVAASHGVQKKRKLQDIEEESSDDEIGESVCCIRFLCWILKFLTEAFDMTFEINDKAKGTRKNLILPSLSTWDDLQDKVSQVLNIHPGSLQLQYRFSNENKNSLPFDLCSLDDYVEMCNQLRPHIVPRILSNGKPSKSARKLVVVQLFNRGMEGVSREKGVKVSS